MNVNEYEIPSKKEIAYGMRKPAIVLSVMLCIGAFVGCFVLQPTGGKQNASSISQFMDIFINNTIVITTIYISFVFTNYYAYIVYALNGLMLGFYIGIALQTNIVLLMLIVPHGIFEIPTLLFSGIWTMKDEKCIRDNIKFYFEFIITNIILVMVCAFIETYITIPIYDFVSK